MIVSIISLIIKNQNNKVRKSNLIKVKSRFSFIYYTFLWEKYSTSLMISFYEFVCRVIHCHQSMLIIVSLHRQRQELRQHLLMMILIHRHHPINCIFHHHHHYQLLNPNGIEHVLHRHNSMNSKDHSIKRIIQIFS